MKFRLPLLQLFLLGFFAVIFLFSETDRQGGGAQRVPGVVQSWLVGKLTDLRFVVRGPVPTESADGTSSNLVIVEIDDDAIRQLGRWPWKRNITAELIESIMKLEPKAVGLDIVFSEYEEVFPERLRTEMQNKGIDTTPYDHDPVLWQTLANHASKIVLGSFATTIRPVDYSADVNQIKKILGPPWMSAETAQSDSFHHLAMGPMEFTSAPVVEKSPLFWVTETLHNIPEISLLAEHQGILNATMDSDGVIRRSPIVFASQGRWYPSLSLELYRVFSGETPDIHLDNNGKIDQFYFKKSNRFIPVNHDGIAQVNYPASPFQTIKAVDLICATGSSICPNNFQRTPASLQSIQKNVKDTVVLVGLTAQGVFDMRSFPYGVNIPGVVGHASVFDNLVRGVFFWTPVGWGWTLGQIFAMTILGLLFVFGMNRLKAFSGVLWFAAFFLSFIFIDFYVLFSKLNIVLNTGAFYLQLVSVFTLTFIAKYMSEEKSKQFVKEAFGKYLSPILVDSIIQDPSKLQLGGEKKELTILFSDIRGFTTFSEKMDPKQLARFLNDYLGIMTDVIFECNGTLDKYIGDAVMAFWGAPLSQSDHAFCALKAAIKMIQRLKEEQPRWKAIYGVHVEVGLGLNSGAVNVGNMGSSKIFEYTVIGDHVNLASRVESLTKTYGVEILTTRFTFDEIQNSGQTLPPHRVLDYVKVKGKKQAIELIEVFTASVDPAAVTVFDNARMKYIQRKFAEAILMFEESCRLFEQFSSQSDGPSTLMIERCRYFIDNPPPEEWDGTWEMHSK